MCILTIGRDCLERIYDVCRYNLLEEPWSPDGNCLDLPSTNAHQTAYGTGAKQSVGFIQDSPAGVIAAYASIDERLGPPNLDAFKERRRCGRCSSGLPNLAPGMCFVRFVGPEQNLNVHIVGVLGANEAEEDISDSNKY